MGHRKVKVVGSQGPLGSGKVGTQVCPAGRHIGPGSKNKGLSPDWCGSVVGHQPKNQEVAGWMPDQGTYLVCGLDAQQGACRRQPIDVVSLLSMFLSILSSL